MPTTPKKPAKTPATKSTPRAAEKKPAPAKASSNPFTERHPGNPNRSAANSRGKKLGAR